MLLVIMQTHRAVDHQFFVHNRWVKVEGQAKPGMMQNSDQLITLFIYSFFVTSLLVFIWISVENK